MNSPARSYAVRRIHKRSSSKSSDGPLIGLLVIGTAFAVMFAVAVATSPDKPGPTPVSAEVMDPQPVVQSENWQDIVEPVFNPPLRLDDVQMKNVEYLDVIPNNPERYPETAHKYSLGLTPAIQEILRGLALSESTFHHVDPDTGLIVTSDKDCKGLMQGCNALCTPDEWLEVHTNAWCGAATFKFFWDKLDAGSNPYLVHYVLAGYKGGFTSIDTDGDGVEDSWERDPATGLPTINSEGEAGAQLAESYLLWLKKN